MISVINDWILKTLPNSDISTPNSYTNTTSCKLFEPVTRLTSIGTSNPEFKYLTSSTGIDIPVYQLNINDISVNHEETSDLYRRLWNNAYSLGYEGHFDSNGKPRQTTTQRIRNIDSYNWENEMTVCVGTSSNKVPAKFKFFNPATKAYDKELTLKYNQEYKNYISGSSGTKRTYKYRVSYYWADNQDNRYYIFESPHLNIDPDHDHYPPSSGEALTSTCSVYISTDIGFDTINEQWVGLLNMFMIPNSSAYGYFTAYDTFVTYSYKYISCMGPQNVNPPYNLNDYASSIGSRQEMLYFYGRAFELNNYTPTIENVTLPLTKIGCYGPNTRIVT